MSEKVNFNEIPSEYSHRVSENCDLIISHNTLSRFTLDHFSDIFSLKEISTDISNVENLKSKFVVNDSKLSPEGVANKVHSRKRSEALEIIIADQIELNDWFGGESLFFRTTEYDDIFNGTDAVVEFNLEDKPERLALAIDSTSQTDLYRVKEKINRNISNMLTNKLEIKYFESQIDGYKGSLKNVVPVVIGLEAGNTNDLIDTFSKLIKFGEKMNDPSLHVNEKILAKQGFLSLKKDIVKHPAQVIFLEEILNQLEMYNTLLNRENNPRVAVKAEDISRLTNIIHHILDDKKNISETSEIKFLRKDTVYNLIDYISGSKN